MLVRRLARPLLATGYVTSGADAVRRPAEHVTTARPVVDRLTTALRLPRTLTDRELTMLVRAHGAATVGAALGLGLGRAPRTSATVLAALTAPLVITQQPFTGRRLDRERLGPFVQQLGALGAALLASADTAGQPSLGWRVRKARAEIASQAAEQASAASARAGRAAEAVKGAVHR